MKKTYYLFNPGRLSRRENTLKFIPVDENGIEQKPRFLPVEGVDELYVLGALDANSSLYNFLGKNGISVHFFDYYENYSGSFMPRDGLLAGRVLLAQTDFYRSKKKRLELARKIIDGAGYNITKNMRYYNSRGRDLQTHIDVIDGFRKNLDAIRDIDELMGLEGNIRNIYYETWDEIINADFKMEGRSKQPPKNEINALISFGNMICYSQCLRAIQQTQLNPTISYLHTPGERRYSLALDLAEIFKPLLVDRTIFKVLNKKEIQAKDFDKKLNYIHLKDAGRKKFIQAFEERLGETIQHRKLKRKVSYKHLIKLECYKLVKHIMKMDTYEPFKIWW